MTFRNIYYKGRSKIMQVILFLDHFLYSICTNFSRSAFQNIIHLPRSPLGQTGLRVNSPGSTRPGPICMGDITYIGR